MLQLNISISSSTVCAFKSAVACLLLIMRLHKPLWHHVLVTDLFSNDKWCALLLYRSISVSAYISQIKCFNWPSFSRYIAWFRYITNCLPVCTTKRVHKRIVKRGCFGVSKAKLKSLTSWRFSVSEGLFPSLCSESHRQPVIERSLAEFSIQASHKRRLPQVCVTPRKWWKYHNYPKNHVSLIKKYPFILCALDEVHSHVNHP